MIDQAISDVYAELAKVVNTTYSKVADRVLIKTKHGIVVYNKYVIRKTKQGIEVICKTGTRTQNFGNAKTALVWAILDHNNYICESKRVLELDCFISSVQIDTEIHRKLKNKGNIEQYLIQFSKLQYDQTRQKQFLYELDKYSILAQRCQQRGTKT